MEVTGGTRPRYDHSHWPWFFVLRTEGRGGDQKGRDEKSERMRDEGKGGGNTQEGTRIDKGSRGRDAMHERRRCNEAGGSPALPSPWCKDSPDGSIQL
eukprot:758482-Hanusia_phi.AAC.1